MLCLILKLILTLFINCFYTLLDGNAYLMIQKRDNLGFPSEVWNLNPADVEINREKGKAIYNWKGEKHEDILLTIQTEQYYI